MAVQRRRLTVVDRTMIELRRRDGWSKEILHPVAITILGDLVSATLLDTLVTQILFHRFGRPALERLRAEAAERRAGGALAAETF